MTRYLFIIAAFAFAFCADFAEAATCFWVGGAGTWSASNTASWASSSGGTTGTCAATGGVPKQAADTATFDASSGGGTVTVDSTINGVTLVGITWGAFTGTLDFSVNNPSMSFTGSFNGSGTGTRTINCGSGTFTFTGTNANNWDLTTTTNLTTNCTSATFAFNTPGNSNSQNFVGGGKSYGTFSIGSRTNGSVVSLLGNNTFSNLAMTCPSYLSLQSSSTTTVNNAFAINGTSSAASQCLLQAGSLTATITAGAPSTATWVGLRGIVGATSSITVTNGFDFGANSGTVSITPPSGGGRIIGG